VRAITGAQLCTPYGPRITFRSTNLALSNSQLIAHNAIEVYPNKLRAGESIYLDKLLLEEPLMLRLLDLQGRMLLASQQEVTAEKQLFTMPSIPAGLYLLQIEQAGRQSFHKIMITN
jgi:hypothetical protein